MFYSNTDGIKPVVVQLTEPVEHGESPVWDHRTQLVYFVDVHDGSLHSYDPNTEAHKSVTFEGRVSAVIPTRGDPEVLVVAVNRSIMSVQWDGKTEAEILETLTTVEQNRPQNRFNDGKADRRGRLWLGTMGKEDDKGNYMRNQGTLYLFTKETLCSPKALVKTVDISNGMTWNSTHDKFYFADTSTNQVTEYDYEEETGDIYRPKIIFDVTDFAKHITGQPDGMTIDVDDNLWIALYNGGAVIKYDPRARKLLQIVSIPAQYTTSVCWGGTNHDILFVTTSRFLLEDEDKKRQPGAGALFAVMDLNTTGLPAFKADITDTFRSCL